MATNFGLTVNSSQTQIVQSLNYALANMGTNSSAVNYNGNVLVANSITGIIQGVTRTGAYVSGVIGYIYNYIDVKYANSATGGDGFTSNCTLANYYGLRNNKNTTYSNNPVYYV
jgi:hypothetical protein